MARKIFANTVPFLSRTLQNVPRDWEKVHGYARHLGVIDSSVAFDDVFTNAYLPEKPFSDLQALPII